MRVEIKKGAESDLKDLDAVSKTLSSKSDSLNHSLQAIQEKLNKTQVGLEVWLTEPLEQPVLTEGTTGTRKEQEEYQLGYGRHGDRWALLVRKQKSLIDWDENDGREYLRPYELATSKPLLEVSRPLRIKAVKQIPWLIRKLRDAATEAVSAIDEAQRLAESIE